MKVQCIVFIISATIVFISQRNIITVAHVALLKQSGRWKDFISSIKVYGYIASFFPTILRLPFGFFRQQSPFYIGSILN